MEDLKKKIMEKLEIMSIIIKNKKGGERIKILEKTAESIINKVKQKEKEEKELKMIFKKVSEKMTEEYYRAKNNEEQEMIVRIKFRKK